MARTTQARYFVRVDTFWANSPDYFVGPFGSREEAQAAIDDIPTEANAWLSTSRCNGDIKDAVRVYPTILTATEAKRSGMRDDLAHPHYNVMSEIPHNAHDLYAAFEGLR